MSVVFKAASSQLMTQLLQRFRRQALCHTYSLTSTTSSAETSKAAAMETALHNKDIGWRCSMNSGSVVKCTCVTNGRTDGQTKYHVYNVSCTLTVSAVQGSYSHLQRSPLISINTASMETFQTVTRIGTR